MPRRSNGEGCIVQRKDGKWQGSISINGQRVTIYGRTRTEVSEQLKQFREQAKINGGLPAQGKLSLKDYLQTWLESIQSNVRPTTYACYESALRLHILPKIGNMQIKKLTPLNLNVFFTSLSKGNGTATVRKVREVLHKSLADAVKWQLITNNPVACVAPQKVEHKDKELWTQEQVQAFLTAMQEGKGGYYGNLWAFLLASGCRLGEALALTRSDVDFNSGVVRITKTKGYVGGTVVENAPKTRAGRRTISLPSWCISDLQDLVGQSIFYGREHLFTTSKGTVPPRRNLLREFHATCRRVGLSEIRVHDLRHLHASLLAMNGVPVKVAQERLGHSTPAVTLGIYSHVLGNSDKLAVNALENLRGNISGVSD